MFVDAKGAIRISKLKDRRKRTKGQTMIYKTLQKNTDRTTSTGTRRCVDMNIT